MVFGEIEGVKQVGDGGVTCAQRVSMNLRIEVVSYWGMNVLAVPQNQVTFFKEKARLYQPSFWCDSEMLSNR